MANTLCFKEDYFTRFDPKIYLEQWHRKFKEDDGTVLPYYKSFHEFWSNYKKPSGTEVRHLEFGGGPSLANVIIASAKADHIVFAEYAEPNRKYVESWIAGEPGVFNWTPLIEVAVELEQGTVVLSDKEKVEAVRKRADELKQKIKSIVPCDVNKSPIVQLNAEDVGRPFDVVVTSSCMATCVTSEEHLKKTVAELCRFLKPDGYLFMNGVLGGTWYMVGDEKFFNFPHNEKLLKEAITEAGINIEKFVTISDVPPEYSEACDCTALYYAYGKKYGEK